MTKQNEKYVYLIIAFLLLIVIAAIAFSNRHTSKKTIVNEKYTQIPRITCSLSSSDGSTHTLSAEFYIDIPEENTEKASVNSIKDTISDVLDNTSYEALSQKDSLSSVVKTIEDKLIVSYPDLDINGVYVQNFLIDFSLGEPSTANIFEMFKPN